MVTMLDITAPGLIYFISEGFTKGLVDMMAVKL